MSHEPDKPPRRSALHRFAAERSIHVLCAMLVLFAAIPAVPHGAVGERLVDGVYLLVMFLATLAVSGGQKSLAWLAALLIVHQVITWSDDLAGIALPPVVEHSLAAGFFGTVVAFGVVRLIHARKVSADTIATALTTYLLMGLFWVYLYLLAYEFAGAGGWSAPLASDAYPGKPQHGLFYFSFTTLTTLGYGDISPVHPGIRSLAIVEAVVGQFFVGVVIARLIGMQLSGAQPSADD